MQTSVLQDRLKNTISKVVKELFSLEDFSVDVNIPTDKVKADLVTNISFIIAKQVKKQPTVVAEMIVSILNKDTDLNPFFSFSFAEPGFINIVLSNKFLILLIQDVKKNQETYGHNNILTGETWVIEHTSPNPNKAMHIGHLRNNLIGMALCRICEICGANVVSEAVDNNRGIAIAKAMYGYLYFKNKKQENRGDIEYWSTHQEEWLSPKDSKLKADRFVGECYLLGSEAFKNNPESEKIIREYVVRWENNNKQIWKLWENIIQYAHEGLDQTLIRIGNKWDKVWHEHEHYKEGKQLIEIGLKKGIFKKMQDGAVLTDLEKYSIPDTILLKSDGTSLYITQDLALTKLKKELYKANKLIWVIGPEQSTAMKQVFACCEQLGIGKLEDFAHVSYGLVNIVDENGKTKKMSSRGGEAILIDDFIDEVKNSLLQLDREYSPELAEVIAIGTIKYSLLRASRNSNVVVDIKNAVNLTGDSGVYLLYTYARMKSLLSKFLTQDNDFNFTFKDHERKIVIELLYFPIIIKNALKDFAPHLIVEYLVQLSQAFNGLYAYEKFITDDVEETSKKAILTEVLSIVFKTSLDLVGIQIPERV